MFDPIHLLIRRYGMHAIEVVLYELRQVLPVIVEIIHVQVRIVEGASVGMAARGVGLLVLLKMRVLGGTVLKAGSTQVRRPREVTIIMILLIYCLDYILLLSLW